MNIKSKDGFIDWGFWLDWSFWRVIGGIILISLVVHELYTWGRDGAKVTPEEVNSALGQMHCLSENSGIYEGILTPIFAVIFLLIAWFIWKVWCALIDGFWGGR